MVAIPERARVSAEIAAGAARCGHAVRDRRVRERRGHARPAHGRRGPLQRQDRRAQGVHAGRSPDASSTLLSAGGDPRAHGLLAHWDFSIGIGPRGVPSDHVADVAGSGHAGTCVNQPARGMTGWNWDGSEECYRHAPELVRRDPLPRRRPRRLPAGRRTSRSTIPADLPSDVYAAARRRGRGRGPHPVLRAAPARHRDGATSCSSCRRPATWPTRTTTSSTTCPVAQSIIGPHAGASREQDFYTYGNLDVGLSTYDVHSDGSGVCFSSSRCGRSSTCGRSTGIATGSRVAVPGRPASGRLAARARATSTTCDRRGPAPRGRRAAAPVPRGHDRLASRVLHRRACWTRWRTTSARAAA